MLADISFVISHRSGGRVTSVKISCSVSAGLLVADTKSTVGVNENGATQTRLGYQRSENVPVRHQNSDGVVDTTSAQFPVGDALSGLPVCELRTDAGPTAPRSLDIGPIMCSHTATDLSDSPAAQATAPGSVVRARVTIIAPFIPDEIDCLRSAVGITDTEKVSVASWATPRSPHRRCQHLLGSGDRRAGAAGFVLVLPPARISGLRGPGENVDPVQRRRIYQPVRLGTSRAAPRTIRTLAKGRNHGTHREPPTSPSPIT